MPDTELAARLRPVLPAGVQAITGAQLATENLDDINSGFLGFLSTRLTAFAAGSARRSPRCAASAAGCPDNALRNPRRTAATASALMVGVAVATLFTVIGASLKASAASGVQRTLAADLVVYQPGYGGSAGLAGFSPQLAADLGRSLGRRGGRGEPGAACCWTAGPRPSPRPTRAASARCRTGRSTRPARRAG